MASVLHETHGTADDTGRTVTNTPRFNDIGIRHKKMMPSKGFSNDQLRPFSHGHIEQSFTGIHRLTRVKESSDRQCLQCGNRTHASNEIRPIFTMMNSDSQSLFMNRHEQKMKGPLSAELPLLRFPSGSCASVLILNIHTFLCPDSASCSDDEIS